MENDYKFEMVYDLDPFDPINGKIHDFVHEYRKAIAGVQFNDAETLGEYVAEYGGTLDGLREHYAVILAILAGARLNADRYMAGDFGTEAAACYLRARGVNSDAVGAYIDAVIMDNSHLNVAVSRNGKPYVRVDEFGGLHNIKRKH